MYTPLNSKIPETTGTLNHTYRVSPRSPQGQKYRYGDVDNIADVEGALRPNLKHFGNPRARHRPGQDGRLHADEDFAKL